MRREALPRFQRRPHHASVRANGEGLAVDFESTGQHDKAACTIRHWKWLISPSVERCRYCVDGARFESSLFEPLPQSLPNA